MARVAVTGSSGLIGTALVRGLHERGDEVVRLVRRPPRAADEVRWDPTRRHLDPSVLDGVDALVNLASAGPGDRRWTAAYKREILASRVNSTHTAATAVAQADHPVRLVCASATGYYGDRGDEPLTEKSGPGSTFFTDVVMAWEAAAAPAVEQGASVAFCRSGIILAEDGPMSRLLTLAKVGMAGPMGGGRMYWSWITLADEVGAIMHLLDHPDVTGPVNLVSREPVPQRELVSALAKVLHRPAFFPAPRFGVHLVVGEFAGEILSSKRVTGDVLVDSGYQHQHPDLQSAVEWLVA
jgi:uncharacterized protein (TIGR01777 family)